MFYFHVGTRARTCVCVFACVLLCLYYCDAFFCALLSFLYLVVAVVVAVLARVTWAACAAIAGARYHAYGRRARLVRCTTVCILSYCSLGGLAACHLLFFVILFDSFPDHACMSAAQSAVHAYPL